MTPVTTPPLPAVFPFAALAGQPALRLALLLAAIDPALGGVLIEGPRGTAKSTAARALAELLPGAGFVTLPLGASLEHLVGTLDLGEALAGHTVRWRPGLLARAHGGVLYVDEVNLLPDLLVDALLDAAASGQHTVERDGISETHAARFALVGTMNPEEGALRPQLLDRFGLCVRLSNLTDPAARQAAVRARFAFDADPQSFRAGVAAQQADLVARVARARGAVAALPCGDDVHARVIRLCLAAGVDGLRADLVLLRAARALAAWEQAPATTPDHVDQVAEMVLTHRRQSQAGRDGHGSASGQPHAQVPGDGGAPPRDGVNAGSDSTASGADELGRPAPTGDHADWGAMPPEPAGLTHVKALRPLPGHAAAKKA